MILIARAFSLLAVIAICSISFAQTYTITSEMEILKPVSLAAMKTDAQKVKVLKETPSTVIVEITIDPTFNQISGLNPNTSGQSICRLE